MEIKNLITTIFILLVTKDAYSYKILLVCPIPTGSHQNICKGFIDILQDANHEVTLITSMPNKTPRHRELIVTIKRDEKAEEEASYKNISKRFNVLFLLLTYTNTLLEATFASPSVQKLLKDANETFDLVLMDYALDMAYAGFGVKYDCPVIVISSTSPKHWLAMATGNPVYPATIPSNYLPFTSDMKYVERLANTVMTIIKGIMGFALEWQQQTSYEKHLPKEAIMVPFSRLHEKIALTFSNSHPSIGFARPFLPNVVEIGGFHVNQNTTLPDEYKKILDDAKHGVIYFSMGSILKSMDLSEKLKTDIVQAFGKRKETILWKYEEDLPNKPNNVIIKSWVPQVSVLAHPNVKLFVSHGGFLSTLESLIAGVPMVYLPTFGDQFLNAKIMQNRGCGVYLETTNITQDSLSWAIEEVIGNPTYTERVKEIQRLYHDRPMKPKDLITFYIDHVIRTGGAKHLSAPHLPLYASLLLDVIAVLLLPPLIMILVIIWVCKKYCAKSFTKPELNDKWKKCQ